jgi:hypothetical protein
MMRLCNSLFLIRCVLIEVQDRYSGHFGLDEDTVEKLTRKLSEGADKVKKSVGA